MAEVKDYSAEALMAKEHEVELDTDNVKEENVSVEEKSTKEEAPNLNVGEVDLGYTGHSKNEEENPTKPEIEITEDKVEASKEEAGDNVGNKEEEKPNLNESRRDYQKRIDKLVFQKKEAERREKAALDFAQGIQKKFDSNLKGRADLGTPFSYKVSIKTPCGILLLFSIIFIVFSISLLLTLIPNFSASCA